MTPPARPWFVYGPPVPQGSTRAFVVKGKARVTHDNAKVKPWRQEIAATARAHGVRVQAGPMTLVATFWLPRPLSRPKRASAPDRRPDLDKLVRAVLDALTGIAWHDDGQVVAITATKEYAMAEQPVGTELCVWGDDARPTRAGRRSDG